MKGFAAYRLGVLILMLSAAFGLTACERAAERAEREYKIAERAGSREDQCAAARRAAAAWRDRGDEAIYAVWASRRDLMCGPATP